MITEIKGDLTQTHATFIAHGVNCQGVMRSGVARALYEKWPEVKDGYLHYCNNIVKNPEERLGAVQRINSFDKEIFNCFTQLEYGYDGKLYLDYEALAKCLRTLNRGMFKYSLNDCHTIAMPKIGCGLAGGDWERVKSIIEGELYSHDVLVYSLDKP